MTTSSPAWLQAVRQEAAARYEATPLPTSSLEEWRYSPIDGLDLDRYHFLDRPSAAVAAAGPADRVHHEALLAAIGETSAVIETVDGFAVDAPPPAGGTGAEGVTVLRAADLEEAPEAIDGAPDAFALANRAYAPDPIVVRVAGGVAAAPVVIVHRVLSDEALIFPRIRIEAGENCQVRVLETVVGPGRALVAPVTELDLGRAARVSYLHLQLLGADAWQIGLQASRVAADATLVSGAVALGGDYARLRTDSALVGPGASSRLLALYFGAGAQTHDFRTKQDHRAPKTTSELLYKGVVANTARSVYSGLIRVEKGARGTTAFQTNRNLVLHDGAHADSVPNLEIEDNDVRCSHASAVGPVSDDERFYLESRGVPPQVTDRLITLGFLGEVIAQLPVPEIGPQVGAALADKLTDAERTEETHP